jgi:hypothetical protein
LAPARREDGRVNRKKVGFAVGPLVALVVAVVRRRQRRAAGRRWDTGGGPGLGGVREPSRPLVPALSGAAAAPLPE